MCTKQKHFKPEKDFILCRYTSLFTKVRREVLVADFTQAFMLMDSLLRSGILPSELDFEMKPVPMVVGGDSDD